VGNLSVSSLPIPLQKTVMNARILGIGAATWDYLYTVDEFPTAEAVVQARNATQSGGGPVASALCVLSRAGHHCTLVDVQGDDPIGQAIRADLQAHGVHLQAIQILAHTTSAQAYIMVRHRDGVRHIAYLPMRSAEPTWSVVQPLLQQHWDLLYLNGRHESTALAAAQWALEKGIPITFDGGAGRYKPSLRALVAASSLLIVAHEFAQHYLDQDHPAEQLGAQLLKDQAQVVVITAGRSGSHIWQRSGEYFHQPAHPVQPVVDTTGCGDIYHGAFVDGWLKQQPLREIAAQASLLAAKTAQGLGGRYALITH
jgi:sulfofructose kinase